MKDNQFLNLVYRGKNDAWRYAVTLLLIILAFFFASVVMSVVLVIATGGVPDLSRIPPLLFLLAAGAPFVFGLAMLLLGVRVIHRRPVKTLITFEARPRWGRFWMAGLIWIALAALGDLITGLILMPGNYAWNLNPAEFVPYAILAVMLIPIQSATEELTFRGYLMQGTSLLSRGPWLPWLLTSTIFGLLHSLNLEVATYGFGLTMAFYIGFGLLLGWLTLRTQGLETALGIHIANNLYGTLLVTFPGSSLPAPALFRMLTYDPLIALVVFLGMSAIFLAIVNALGWGKPSVEIMDQPRVIS